jgi:hypothetical protein
VTPLTRRERQQISAWYLNLPIHDIPAERFHSIQAVANGITMPLWGRPALPDQIAYLHRENLVEPQQIHQAFGELPHPHAPNVQVKDYADYTHAYKAHEEANQK